MSVNLSKLIPPYNLSDFVGMGHGWASDPGSKGSSPNNLTNVNGKLFFSADDGVHGRALWVVLV